MKTELTFEIGSVSYNESKEKFELTDLKVSLGGEQTEGETKSIIESTKERVALVKEFVCAAPEMAKAIKDAVNIIMSSMDERIDKLEMNDLANDLQEQADEAEKDVVSDTGSKG